MTLSSIDTATREANIAKVAAAKAKRKAARKDKAIALDYMRTCTPEAMAELLSAYANNYNVGRDAGKQFAMALMRDHRTLQQSVIRFLVSALVVYGNEVGDWYDGRNEQGAKFCRKFAGLVEDGTLDTYFPMI